jgi:hypothetical protein
MKPLEKNFVYRFKNFISKLQFITVAIMLTYAFCGNSPFSFATNSIQETQKGDVRLPPVTRNQVDEHQRTRISMVPEYIIIRQKSLLIGGYGSGVGVNYHHSRNIGFGAQVRQLFSTKNLDSLYTAFDFRLMWWPLGFDVKNESRIVTDRGKTILRRKMEDSGGLQIDLSVKEIFFNTETGVMPMGGFGLALMYQFATDTNTSFGLGSGLDRMRGTSGETFLILRAMLQWSLLI